MPGIGVDLLIRDGLFVKNRSKMLESLVGKSTIWVSPRSPSSARKASFIGFLYRWLMIELFGQSISGRLKSPAIQITASLNLFQTELMVSISSVV